MKLKQTKIALIIIISFFIIINLNPVVISSTEADKPEETAISEQEAVQDTDTQQSEAAGELTGDQITINSGEEKDVKEIVARGNVVMNYQEMKVEGDFARFETETEDILLEGNIKFFHQDYTITGNQLQGNLGTEKFELTGDTYFEYKDLEAVADRVIFNLKEEEALLRGHVSGKNNGQEFSAREVTVDMATDEISLTGKARLQFSDKGEKE